jgi:phenylalanyl-tRNA synthetase beta chain
MGGRETEVTDATTDILIEVANFDPARVRAARRRLGMSTDASYRFERGVDVELAPAALNRVTQLVMAVAGGRVESAPADILVADALRTPIVLRTSRVERVLGDRVAAGEIARLLRLIGFEADVEDGGASLRVVAPSWRTDALHEIDLIEEVARLRGYDSLPNEIRPFRATNVPDDPRWVVADRVRTAMAGAGLFEAKPLPFVRGADRGFVRVANPIADNEPYLRREVTDSLARRAEYNLAHMAGNVRLFEIGSVWFPGDGDMPNEELHLGLIVMGRRQPSHWSDAKSPDAEKAAAYDEWDAKWLAEVAARIAYPRAATELRPHDGGGNVLWEIVVDGVRRGKVERAAVDTPVWASAAYAVELSLGTIDASDVAPPREHAHREPEPTLTSVARYRALPAMPAAEFDLALLLPDSVTAADVERTIRKSAGDLLERLELFDLYTGKGVEGGLRSVAWRLTFRHAERTLRDKEIEGRRARILSALEGELNVRQRST